MNHSQQPLKTALKKKIEQPSLSAEQLAQLQAIQQGQPEKPKPRPKRLASIIALAACLVLAVYFANHPKLTTNTGHNHAYEIAQEAAKNHLKLKPLEVHANTIVEIGGYFTELDFQPVSSALLKTLNADSTRGLIGGRYCSLKGISAAQLRYQDPSGLISTFYEVPYDQAIYGPIPSAELGERPLVVYAKGIKNKLWVEKGLLMVLSETDQQ